MAQNITLPWNGGASYSNVPAVTLPKTGGGTARFDDCTVVTAVASDVAQGKIFVASNGTVTTGTASSGGSSMNYQIDNQYKQRTANSYGSTGLTLTVAKTGTYTVTWVAWRSSSSGTMGTNLHVGNTSGTNQQTFTGTYGQLITLTNQHYNQGDVLTLYATSGSTTRSIYVANLTIIQTA